MIVDSGALKSIVSGNWLKRYKKKYNGKKDLKHKEWFKRYKLAMKK